MHLPDIMDDATMRNEMSMESQFSEAGASLDRRFDRIDEKFDRIEERLAKIDVRLDKLEHDVRLLAEGLVAFEERMDRRFDEVNARLDGFIAWCQGMLQNYERRITALEKPPRTRRRRN